MRQLFVLAWFVALVLASSASGADSTASQERPDISAVPAELTQSTSERLWAEFAAAPYTHPTIPNVSFAGYQFSERPIPSPEVTANVKVEGARGDGETDDTAAFRQAIEKAQKAGGGAILIPAGHYKLSDALVIAESNLVLRGEGSDRTFLEFTVPVTETSIKGLEEWLSRKLPSGSPAPSWYGGLIWVEPDKPNTNPTKTDVNVQPLAEAVPITASANQGDFKLELSAEDAAKLKPLVGKMVPVVWTGGRELALQIAGHDAMKKFDWSRYRELYDGVMTWVWANQIEAVEGNQILFKKPLRMDAVAGRVSIGTTSPYLTNVGIEGLAVQFPLTEYPGHHKELGYNGLMFRKVAHCWVRDVSVVNADSSLIMGGECINCTVTGLKLSGRQNHHGTMTRFMSHDNLFEKFQLESPTMHGINSEGLSSGNVWHDGTLLFGTFDYHRMMSFDSVRTNITVENTGGSGGNGTHGPGVGRRICHWNVRITSGNGRGIAQPGLYSNAALVGIQGAPLDLHATDLGRMPDGLNKGCVIADQGREPSPPDLFEAQLRLRLGKLASADRE
jgi:hypothetical protein